MNSPQNIHGKQVTHKNKHYKDGIAFHITPCGDVSYFSETYNKWMPSEFTPIDKLVKV